MLKKILKLFRGSKNKLYKFAQLNKVLRHKGELYIGGYTTLSKNTILTQKNNLIV